MKKAKLNLEDLQVESFTTSKARKLNGGGDLWDIVTTVLVPETYTCQNVCTTGGDDKVE